MRAIVNGKLYDTKKSKFVQSVVPIINAWHIKNLDVFRTQKGNIFAVDKETNEFIDSARLKELLGGAGNVSAHIEIFGMPEEA